MDMNLSEYDFIAQIKSHELPVAFVTEYGSLMLYILSDPEYNIVSNRYTMACLEMSVDGVKKSIWELDEIMSRFHFASQNEIDWMILNVDDCVIGVYERVRSKLKKEELNV